MKALSAFLFLVAATLATASAFNVGHRDFLTGVQLIGWTLVALALLLAFTMPMRCRVRKARGAACSNNAYGFLLGCSQGAGHWSGKFRARLGLQGDTEKPVGEKRSESSHEAMYHPTEHSQPIRVKVEDSKLSICASWAGVLSAITGIAAIIVPIVAH